TARTGHGKHPARPAVCDRRRSQPGSGPPRPGGARPDTIRAQAELRTGTPSDAGLERAADEGRGSSCPQEARRSRRIALMGEQSKSRPREVVRESISRRPRSPPLPLAWEGPLSETDPAPAGGSRTGSIHDALTRDTVGERGRGRTPGGEAVDQVRELLGLTDERWQLDRGER